MITLFGRPDHTLGKLQKMTSKSIFYLESEKKPHLPLATLFQPILQHASLTY